MSNYIFEKVQPPKIISIYLFINKNLEFKLSPKFNVSDTGYIKTDDETLKLEDNNEIYRYYRHNITGDIYFVSNDTITGDISQHFFQNDISNLQHIIDGDNVNRGEITKIYKNHIFLKEALYSSTDGAIYSPFLIQKYGMTKPFIDSVTTFNITSLFNVPNDFTINIPTDIFIFGDVAEKKSQRETNTLTISPQVFQNIKTNNIYINNIGDVRLNGRCFSNISNLNEINSSGEEILSNELNLFLNGIPFFGPVGIRMPGLLWVFNFNNIIFDNECMYNFLGNIYVRIDSIINNIADKINVFKNDINNDYDLNLIFPTMNSVNKGFDFDIPEGTFYGRKFKYYIIDDIATIIENSVTIGKNCNNIGDSAFRNTEIKIIQFHSSTNILQLDENCFNNGINNIDSNIIFERPVVLNGNGVFSNCSMKTLHFKNNYKIIVSQTSSSGTTYKSIDFNDKMIIKPSTFSNTNFNQELNDNEFNIIFDDTNVRDIECDIGAFSNINKCKMYVGYNNLIINDDTTINNRNITIITSFKNKKQFITNFGEFNINIKIIAIDAFYYFINPDTTKEEAINNYELNLGTKIENIKPTNYDDYLNNYITYKNFNRNYFKNKNIINIYHLYDLMDNNL